MDSIKQLWVSAEMQVQNQGNAEESLGNRWGNGPFLNLLSAVNTLSNVVDGISTSAS